MPVPDSAEPEPTTDADLDDGVSTAATGEPDDGVSTAATAEPGADAAAHDPVVDPEHRAAIRSVRLMAVALGAVVVGLAVMTLTWLLRDDPGGREVGRVASPVDVPEASDALVTAIGPGRGVAADDYVEVRHRVLTSAEGERLAVVSFDSYAVGDDLDALIGDGDGDGVERLALLVAPPGGGGEVITESLEEWAERTRAEAQAERDEIADLAPTVDEPEFRGFYFDELDRLAAVIAGAQPAADVVFGAVVRAPADALRALVDVDGVRLVDAGAGPRPARDARYRGVRPEERVVGSPELRPA